MCKYVPYTLWWCTAPHSVTLAYAYILLLCGISVLAMVAVATMNSSSLFPTLPDLYSAQLWSQGIKVSSIQTGCEEEPRLMGLIAYSTCRELSETKQRQRGQRGWEWENKMQSIGCCAGGQLLGRKTTVLLWQYAFLLTQVSWARAASAVWALFKKQWRSGS